MSTDIKISVADLDRMIAEGAFTPKEEHHVELIRGELREMSPIGLWHCAIVDFLTAWSIRNTPEDQVIVRVQGSVQFIELDSVPQPDVVWTRKKSYFEGHPTAKDVLLLIEVAESSLAFDRGEKAELYAAAGIQDYWIVNIRDRVVEVYREPAGNQFRQKQTFATGESLAPLALPELQLAVVDLWPAK